MVCENRSKTKRARKFGPFRQINVQLRKQFFQTNKCNLTRCAGGDGKTLISATSSRSVDLNEQRFFFIQTSPITKAQQQILRKKSDKLHVILDSRMDVVTNEVRAVAEGDADVVTGGAAGRVEMSYLLLE